MPKKLTKEEFIVRAIPLHTDKDGKCWIRYDLINDSNWNGTIIKVPFYCTKIDPKTGKEHGIFWQSPNSHNNKNHMGDCPICGNMRKGATLKILKETFITTAILLHTDENGKCWISYRLINDDTWINTSTKVPLYCTKTDEIGNEHGIFWQTPNAHNKKILPCGCPICANVAHVYKEKFIQLAIPLHTDENGKCWINYNLINDNNWINMHTKVPLYCTKIDLITGKEHGEFWQSPAMHNEINRPRGCPICGFEASRLAHIKTKEDFIIQARAKWGDEFGYDDFDLKGFHIKGKILHHKCGNIFEQSPADHCYKSGCPFCRESQGEKRIERWLKEHHYKFIRQKRYADCKDKRKLPYDFYLPDYNILIEYDGEQHFRVVRFNEMDWYDAVENFKRIKKHDRIKNRYANKNNIPLLRIEYWNFKIIELILDSLFNI